MKFTQTAGDPCLYVSTDEAKTVLPAFAVYVDDILIAGKTDKRIAEVKGCPHKMQFKMHIQFKSTASIHNANCKLLH